MPAQLTKIRMVLSADILFGKHRVLCNKSIMQSRQSPTYFIAYLHMRSQMDMFRFIANIKNQ